MNEGVDIAAAPVARPLGLKMAIATRWPTEKPKTVERQVEIWAGTEASCGFIETSSQQEKFKMSIIATAGWSIPKTVADRFPEERTGLARYASLFSGVEINSTFYQRHRTSTFARWAESVPENFRFSVKIPKEITHTRAMMDIAEPIGTFFEDIAPLGLKRGPVLCQLPPSLAFAADRFEPAFKALRAVDSGQIVIEARHKSWASADATDLLTNYAIDRVLADPERVWTVEDFREAPRYVRLHGKPKIYYSTYTHEEIARLLKLMAPDGWCVFDNTASGAAIENALTMFDMF